MCVESDGSQSIRAMVESDCISLHINDWYGGSSTGFGEWRHYGTGKTIEPGDTIESTVRLHFVRPARP